MSQPRSRSYTRFLSDRNRLLETIVLALFLALSINLLSSVLVATIPTLGWVAALSVGLILLSLLWLSCTTVKSLRSERTLKGIVLYSPQNRETVPIPHYAISEDLSEALSALFIENPQLRENWNRSPLSWEPGEGEGREYSLQLLREAVEYSVMKKLSLHLGSYFPSESPRVASFSRQDIPGVVLENRFIDAFSRELSDRSTFRSRAQAEGPSVSASPPGELHYANRGGAIYDKMELRLPVGSLMTRPGKSTIMISTARFQIEIQSVVDGFLTSTPRNFERLYVRSGVRLDAYIIKVIVRVRIRPFAVLSMRNHADYGWIDSFSHALANYVSFARFRRRINWDAVNSVLHCLSQARPRPRGDTERSEAGYEIRRVNAEELAALMKSEPSVSALEWRCSRR